MRIPELVALMTNPLLAFTGGATYTPMSALNPVSPDWGASANASPSTSAVVPARGQDSLDLSGEDPASQNAGGALLDQYIRKRAVVSFSIPQLGAKLGGGAAQFTFEIETAYRLISPVEPGYLTDESA